MPRPTARVLSLLEILQTGGTHSAGALATEVGVNQRTVRRYVEHLIDLDIPIRTIRGRYGGYHLGAGYRMPPLMLTDDEALAVLLGLVAAQRVGVTTSSEESGTRAAAKIRRVLPRQTARRLDALLQATELTQPDRTGTPARVTTLILLAEAVRDQHPVQFSYTSREGRQSARTLHPYGIVAHSGRWYVIGLDSAGGEARTFRLDRIVLPRVLPGSFTRPHDFMPSAAVLDSLATTPWAHAVSVRVQADLHSLRGRVPPGLATLQDAGDGWSRLRLRAERLDWVPAFLAGLDLPFAVEAPDELRHHMHSFAERLQHYAATT